MTPLYKLEGHRVVLCDDLMAWAEWFETANRDVAVTNIGNTRVSTVFLGIDHNFFGHGDPLLFETMVFVRGSDKKLNWSPVNCRRYFMWEEAEIGHAEMVAEVKRWVVTLEQLQAQGHMEGNQNDSE